MTRPGLPVPPSHPGASPCERFEEAALLRVDRELPAAEIDALERHLDLCPSCRRLAREAEGVSRVLKRWDAERVSNVRAPHRLRVEIRSAVLEAARLRRAEVRRVRYGTLAMAASVLVVLGLASLLATPGAGSAVAGPDAGTIARAGPPSSGSTRGSTVPQAPPPAPLAAASLPPAPYPAASLPPAPYPAASLPPAPYPAAPYPTAPYPTAPLPPSALAALGPVEAGALLPLGDDQREAMREPLVRLALADRVERAFERGVGEPGVPWIDPRTGDARRISLGALACLQAHGAGGVEGYLHWLGDRFGATTGRALADAHHYAEPRTWVDTGRHVPDLVGLPRGREAVDRLLSDGALHLAGIGIDVHLLATDTGPGGGASAPAGGAPQVYDLRRAIDDGVVELKDGVEDDVVAIVKGSRHPIFLPVGELLAGGRVDRAVARPVWIHAVRGEERFAVTCFPVGSPRRGEAPPIRAVGVLAGPTMRDVLARATSRDSVMAAVDREVEPRGPDAYSLLGFYDAPTVRRAVTSWTSLLNQRASAGFVVTDDVGALVGIEASDLPREAAADLLARLLVGYTCERAIPSQQRARSRAQSARATAAAVSSTTPARVTLLGLVGTGHTFKTASDATGPVRAVHLLAAEGSVRVDAVEDRATGRAVQASALPTP